MREEKRKEIVGSGSVKQIIGMGMGMGERQGKSGVKQNCAYVLEEAK